MAKSITGTATDFCNFFHQRRSAIRMMQIQFDREKNETCDVKFKVDGKIFNAHKSVMINATKYFRILLTGPFEESFQDVIQLLNIEREVFQLLLDFIYGAQMDFAKTPVDTLVDARRVADMWCLKDFIFEMNEFIKNIPFFDDCGRWYTFAKEINAIEVAKSLKLALFARLAPFQSLKTKFITYNHENSLESAEFELMSDVLKLFSTPEWAQQFLNKTQMEELNKPKSVQIRLKGVAEWIEAHKNETMDRFFGLTEHLGLEHLPMETFQAEIEELFKNDKCLASHILTRQMTQIREKMNSLMLRATWVRVNANRIFMADFHTTTKRWELYETVLQTNVALYTIEDNLTYFLTSGGMLDIQDMDTVAFTGPSIPVPLSHLRFKYLDMVARKGYVYIYAKNNCSGRTVLLILNEKTGLWEKHDMKLSYYPTSMTISDGKVYFVHGRTVLNYDPEKRDLARVASCYMANLFREKELSVVKFANDLYVFGQNGFYSRNPNYVSCSVLPVDHSAGFNEKISVCGSNQGIVVALSPDSHPGPVKILLGVGDTFKSMGFLSDPDFNQANSGEENARLILTQISLPRSRE